MTLKSHMCCLMSVCFEIYFNMSIYKLNLVHPEYHMLYIVQLMFSYSFIVNRIKYQKFYGYFHLVRADYLFILNITLLFTYLMGSRYRRAFNNQIM